MASSTEPCCGNCRFGHKMPAPADNLALASQLVNKRYCRGAPPSGLVVNGQIVSFRPTMDAEEPACALWQPRIDA